MVHNQSIAPYSEATALLARLRAGELTAETLTRFYLDRIAAYAELNAVAELAPDALEQARALDAGGNRMLPLFGLPLLVKDNIDVKGLHTTAGSLALADHTADRDAPVIANLRRNGAILLGKTNMTEFANYTTQDMPNGFSSRGGQVRNAYHASADPGGSSSGSGVAASAGLCAAAIGTDTSFSVIACATSNGVTGVKPPHGALSQTGILPISHTLDSAGTLARSMRDALLIDGGMRDTLPPPVHPVNPRALRLAINTFHSEQVSPEQTARYGDMLGALSRLGGRVDEVCHGYPPELKIIMRCEFKHDLEAFLGGRPTLAEIVAFYRADASRMPYGISCLTDALASSPTDADYAAALRERERVRDAMIASLEPFDACLMTGPTCAMHFAGLPSVAIRLGMGEDGLPRGAILYGMDERRLHAAALTLETLCQPVLPPDLKEG